MEPAHELKSFGKYRLLASLGSGGMAKVYLALMTGPAGFNKLLVLKILRQDLGHLFGATAESVQMFWKEARLAARLSHPNIVQTHEVGEVDGHYFIAMEYLDGQPYSATLTRMRSTTVAFVEHLRVVSEVARALHYSHTLKSYDAESVGVIHRDVSPHNIIVTYDGQVKLLDFGVATSEDPEHVTRVGVIKGKLDYIAPEQLRGDAIDGRADVFALGAVLWEALSGQRFGGGRRVADALKVQARLNGGERKLEQLRPTLPEQITRIVERAIALDPEQRFEDAAAFADALDAYMVATGERPSPQSLSAIMTPLFELERSQLHDVINTQLQALKRESSPGDLSHTGNLPELRRLADDGLISFLPEPPDVAHDATQAVSSGFTRAAVARQSVVGLLAPQKRVAIALIAGVTLASAALALAWPSWRAQPERQALQSKPAAASAPVDASPRTEAADSLPPRASAAPELVLLEVNVVPTTAVLTVDGVAVATPFSGQFRKDASLHLVEATADGFQPVRQFVKLDRDQTLGLALGRAGWSTRRSRVLTAPVHAHHEQAAASELPPVNTRSSKRATPGADIDLSTPSARGDEIDQANPYSNKK